MSAYHLASQDQLDSATLRAAIRAYEGLAETLGWHMRDDDRFEIVVDLKAAIMDIARDADKRAI